MKKLLLTLLVGLPAAMVAGTGDIHGGDYVLKAENAVALNDADAVDLAHSDTLEALEDDAEAL